ncbi:MAG: hypothetical protein RR877_00175 [Aurantimicrobium sp.]|uniref:hypothetical protein n=1 Tax=Aurantimicrobium sp. TaxID=1930784 RepID=UPI002FC8A528
MSLKSVGVHGSISTVTVEGNFKSNKYGNAKDKKDFLEAEKELFRNLFEAYLNSEQFKKDVYQLGSTINVKIKRSVDLVMPNEG